MALPAYSKNPQPQVENFLTHLRIVRTRAWWLRYQLDVRAGKLGEKSKLDTERSTEPRSAL